MHYFILNPGSQSFGSRTFRSKLIGQLKQSGIEYKLYATRRPGHGRELSRAISSRDPHATIIAIGGDGTIHDILSGLTNISTVTFGVIPYGSGNDFARGMHIPASPQKAISAVISPKAFTEMDIGVLTDKTTERFGVSCGIGFDASVCHEALESPIKNFLNHVGLGNLTYAVICLKQLALYEPCIISIDTDDGSHFDFPKAYFTAVMNQKYEGGGVKMTPEAEPNDGLLDVIVASDMSRGKISRVLPMAFFGKHTKAKGLHFIKCKDVTITCSRELAVHLDGESGGVRSRIHAGLEKERLRVITG
ncbi:MAG: diacylglycerol kinase family lipid kinase [Lachnospiraceae bacterium]|nr:diacylglycerol kinase family lipid kinase [Lachnospiraceae bacterium]